MNLQNDLQIIGSVFVYRIAVMTLSFKFGDIKIQRLECHGICNFRVYQEFV